MAFEKELPEWKGKGVKPPQSKLDEGWKVQDKPPAAWLNWQMNKTYEALKEVQEKAAEKSEVASAIEDTKKYSDQKVAGIDLTKITPDSIGATKKIDFDIHAADKTKHITADERNAWNAKETPGGAQAKANQAETNAKNYIDSKAWQKHKVASDDGTAIDISNRDLNSIVHTGFYKGTNMGNAPALVHGWGYVEVITHAPGSWVLQKVYDLHADRFYMRRLQDNGWTAWTQDLFQSGVDAKNRIAGAISAKGVPASASDTFEQLASKIQTIETGRKYASSSFYRSLTYDGTFEVNSLSFKPSEVILLLNLVVVEYSDGSGIAGRTQNMAMVLGWGSAQYEDMGIKLSVGVEFLNNGFVVNHKVHSIGEFYRGAVQVTRWEAIS
ncbi:hypothetical protein SAMN04488689_101558 [Paenibacillus sp. cl6col]|uniref:pyocin knob domain-containing protein n=1 Tax=Paenibacillus sp. cl6col TaxID=1761878 RepID=UPI00087F9CC3|nr:pyocin knob domain-containing protein [Paenibacillus sp. cl6col]SDE45558.1 hypothetical protein SAMN04488689_101558 [Paenibacillus sp. cl6col]